MEDITGVPTVNGQRKSSRSGLLVAGGAVGEPVAVAGGGGDDVGVVAEPVEQADGGWQVREEAGPSASARMGLGLGG